MAQIAIPIQNVVGLLYIGLQIHTNLSLLGILNVQRFTDKIKFRIDTITKMYNSNEILGWEGVGTRQLLCFFKA
jgi:hypothetical protein